MYKWIIVYEDGSTAFYTADTIEGALYYASDTSNILCSQSRSIRSIRRTL